MRFKKLVVSTLTALTIVLSMIAPYVQVFAEESPVTEIEDIEVTPEQLIDGVTVVLVKNNDGTFEQVVYSDTDFAAVPQPAATADGVLEWAAFHLGFNNWNNDTGRLYFTISADEPMKKVTGNAYVKSTSILFPTTYYSDSFNKSLGGSMNTSRVLHENVDTGDEDRVRVGFSNVVLLTVADEYGYFSNTSQVVDR